MKEEKLFVLDDIRRREVNPDREEKEERAEVGELIENLVLRNHRGLGGRRRGLFFGRGGLRRCGVSLFDPDRGGPGRLFGRFADEKF